MNYYYVSIIIIVLALVINGYITGGYITGAPKKEQFQINVPVNFPDDFNVSVNYLSQFNSGDIEARNLNGNIEETHLLFVNDCTLVARYREALFFRVFCKSCG